MSEFCPRAKYGKDAIEQIELINKHHGSKWKLGDDMEVTAGGITIEAMLVGAEKGCFRIMIDGDNFPHGSIFKPSRCSAITK